MAKAQGRGSAERMVVGMLLALNCCSLMASAATWTVGGSQGWRIGTDYTAWAAGQSYTTGDVLFFPYAKDTHDVVEVNKADYDACSATGAIATYVDGNTNVTLNATGTHYYLCSYSGHCTAGMKLAVTVGAGATPAAAPSTNVGTPPTPATSAQAPTPTSTAPAPTLPTSAPTPTSTAPVPSPASATAPVPSPASVGTRTSAPPPSVGTPSGTPPSPDSAASLPSASLAGVAIWLSAALLAL